MDTLARRVVFFFWGARHIISILCDRTTSGTAVSSSTLHGYARYGEIHFSVIVATHFGDNVKSQPGSLFHDQLAQTPRREKGYTHKNDWHAGSSSTRHAVISMCTRVNTVRAHMRKDHLHVLALPLKQTLRLPDRPSQLAMCVTVLERAERN